MIETNQYDLEDGVYKVQELAFEIGHFSFDGAEKQKKADVEMRQ